MNPQTIDQMNSGQSKSYVHGNSLVSGTVSKQLYKLIQVLQIKLTTYRDYLLENQGVFK